MHTLRSQSVPSVMYKKRMSSILVLTVELVGAILRYQLQFPLFMAIRSGRVQEEQ